MSVTYNDMLKLFTSVWEAVCALVNHRSGQEHQGVLPVSFFQSERTHLCSSYM